MTQSEGSDADAPSLSRWAVASSGTRATAKWMIVSLSAAGALVFGAGPIVSKPELSWQEDKCQLFIAVLTGTVGLIAVVSLVGILATVLAPIKISLENVPAEMKADINSSSGTRLPSDSNTYEDFLLNYSFHRNVVANLEANLAALPSSPPAGSVDDARRKAVQTNLSIAKNNLDGYVQAASGYLDQVEYYSVSALFKKVRLWALIFAVLAGVGALGFQLALAAPVKKEESKEAGQLGYIDVPSGDNLLWNGLGLASCSIGAEVPVLIEKGTGSDSDPYNVSVIAIAPGCVPKSFIIRRTELTLHTVSFGSS